MGAFTLKPLQDDYYAVFHDGRKVALLLPATPARVWWPAQAEPWRIIPDPEAFPDASCKGIPAPLKAAGHEFASLAEVGRFLGVEREQVAA